MAGDSTLYKVRLLEDLQLYSCLYNKCSRDFKDKSTKMTCWTALVEKHNAAPQEAELRFKNIQTAYRQFLKCIKSIPSGSGCSDIPVPPGFGNMEWLSVFIDHWKTNDNCHGRLVAL